MTVRCGPPWFDLLPFQTRSGGTNCSWYAPIMFCADSDSGCQSGQLRDAGISFVFASAFLLEVRASLVHTCGLLHLTWGRCSPLNVDNWSWSKSSRILQSGLIQHCNLDFKTSRPNSYETRLNPPLALCCWTSYRLGPPGPHRHPSLSPIGALDFLVRRPPADAPTGGLRTSPRVLVWLKVSIKKQGQEFNRIAIDYITKVLTMTPCVLICLNMVIIINISNE